MPPASLLAASLTALLAAAASRPWGLGALALVAYAPTLLALCSARRAWHGAVMAALAAVGLCSVAYEAAQGLFPGAYVAAVVVGTLPYLGVGALAVRARLRLEAWLGTVGARAAMLALLPPLWCAAEWLPSRPELLGVWALPLGFVGYSQIDLPTVQVARIGSVTAVSHLVLATNAAVALGWLALRGLFRRTAARIGRPARPRPANRGAVAASLLTLMLPAAALAIAVEGRLPGASDDRTTAISEGRVAAPAEGRTSISAEAHAADTSRPSLSVRLVQPALPDAAYFAARSSDEAAAALVRRLTLSATGDSADLVVLPEAAWPGVIEPHELESVAATVAEAFAGTPDDRAVLFGAPDDRAVLFGAPARGFAPAGAMTNSAFLFSGGAVRHAYAKRRLVPVGETRMVAGWVPAIVDVAGVGVAPLVCYDALFPSDVRATVLAGAEILAVMTDDAFAAASDVPELHLRAARMRAIETGVPVVLAANTGPSAAIGPDGRVMARLDPLTAGSLVVEVSASEGSTPYVNHGDWLGGADAAIAGGLLFATARGGRDKKRST